VIVLVLFCLREPVVPFSGRVQFTTSVVTFQRHYIGALRWLTLTIRKTKTTTKYENSKTNTTYKAVYLRKGTKGAPALRTGDGEIKILLPPVNSPHTPSSPHGHTAQQQHYNNPSNITNNIKKTTTTIIYVVTYVYVKLVASHEMKLSLKNER